LRCNIYIKMKIRFTILIYKRTLSVLGFDSTQRSFNINQNRFVKTNKLDVKADYYYSLTAKSNLNLTVGTPTLIKVITPRFSSFWIMEMNLY
jgi:hypothetical protein